MAKKHIAPVQLINRRLLRMNRLVSAAVEQAIRSLVEQDETLARQVVAGDDEIDAHEVRIEQSCIDLLTAGGLDADHIRYVLCVIKINNDLERIADCAVDVAERLPGFVQREAPALPNDLWIMANSAFGMVRDAVKAWVAQDPRCATEVLRADVVVDALYDRLATDMRDTLSRPSSFRRHYLDYLLAARDFERIADHATNIAECAIHSATGRIVRHQTFNLDHLSDRE
jgi:phosphate transport system protein